MQNRSAEKLRIKENQAEMETKQGRETEQTGQKAKAGKHKKNNIEKQIINNYHEEDPTPSR